MNVVLLRVVLGTATPLQLSIRVQPASMPSGILLHHIYRSLFAASLNERFFSRFFLAFFVKSLEGDRARPSEGETLLKQVILLHS